MLSNDDGLTSNVKALYEALKKDRHDVILSVPCVNQSGMGAAIAFSAPSPTLAEACLNDAAKVGDPTAGPMTRRGLSPDYHYVKGTPVMATMYGIDVLARKRWGKAPDLVLSGPNEGQNVGMAIIGSGTVSNAQFAAIRGIPAIAISAGEKTADAGLANPDSPKIARLVVDLVDQLSRTAKNGRLMPEGMALNVNFPDRLEGATWVVSRIGSYQQYDMRFVEDMSAERVARGLESGGCACPGVTVAINHNPARTDQQQDESVVFRKNISVSPMQAGYDSGKEARSWLQASLNGMKSGFGH
ncbi:5'/3'-nucleotidase SurE [Sphingobium bisphenolivorans]|uniref:5'/3'-nucleotidase SurE n=1 Tax=Sphingobium bisphenolivorans TaxID=1335760 RepID=UPI001EE75D33|nr:5'/3'-nucleotidase SurE [Sphingobium bisphenolivorans]